MKKIFKLFGIIALTAVIGFCLFGCDDEEDGIVTWTFTNNSSYEIEILCDDLSPSNFKVAAGGYRTATSTKRQIGIRYDPFDFVEGSSKEANYTFTNRLGVTKYTYTFYNISTYSITVSCNDLYPSSFTVFSGNETTAISTKNGVLINYNNENYVNCNSITGGFRFVNKGHYIYTFVNNSSESIFISSSDLIPYSFTVNSKTTKVASSSKTTFYYNAIPSFVKSSTNTITGTITFYD